jgi:aldose sugar dehydrogenase
MKKIILILFFVLIYRDSFCQTYTFDTLVRGIREPSAFCFLPNGNIILTQKHDSAKIYSLNNQLISCFWNFYDSCVSNGERGLIGVCLDPNYSVNKYIYFYYNHNVNNLYRIVRLKDVNNLGTEPRIIFNDSSGLMNVIHLAGNIKFGRDNKLYISIGDNGVSANAQSLSTFKGKILRINSDGTIPTDNPFYDDGNPKTGNDDRIWAYGLRNSYDFIFSPVNDSIYATENGSSIDEVNFIRKGKNFGWPVCEGYCNPYNPLYKQPMATWTPSYVPTGLMIYNGSVMPELNGRLLISTYSSQGITNAVLGNVPYYDTIVSRSLITGVGGSTTILQGPDDYIYIARFTNFTGMILRMKHNTVGINNTGTPVSFILEQNYPNPFNPVTSIKYSVSKQSFVTLQLYDVLGREIETIVNETKQAGSYEVDWNAENYPSGVYLYKLTSGDFSEQKKMVLLK